MAAFSYRYIAKLAEADDEVTVICDKKEIGEALPRFLFCRRRRACADWRRLLLYCDS